MALDANLVKSIDTTTTAATYYPVGDGGDGDATKDEFFIFTTPEAEVTILVPSQVGTSPTLDATVQFSDDVAFGTVLSSLAFKQITASDTFPLRRSLKFGTRAKYGRVKLVTAGTNPGFGVVKAWMGGDQSHHNYAGATYD